MDEYPRFVVQLALLETICVWVLLRNRKLFFVFRFFSPTDLILSNVENRVFPIVKTSDGEYAIFDVLFYSIIPNVMLDIRVFFQI